MCIRDRYNADGSYNYQGNGYWRIGNDYQHNAVLNPVAMANLQSDVVDRMAIVGKVFAELELYLSLIHIFQRNAPIRNPDGYS